MAKNVFVSFDHDDQNQVGGFKSLKNNPGHPLDFHDHSLKDAVTDRSGNPIKYPPSDDRSKPVRDEIITKFNNCSKLVVLIGDNTYTSKWVEWEINSFFKIVAVFFILQLNVWNNSRIPIVVIDSYNFHSVIINKTYLIIISFYGNT